MRHGAIWLAIPAGLVGAALAAWLLWPSESSRSTSVSEPEVRVSRSVPPSGPVTPNHSAQAEAIDEHATEAAPEAAERVEEAADPHDHGIAEDPTGDLRYYEKYPMSRIPHRVVRGWGARGAGSLPGAVGVFVVVDPRISDAELETLARDIRDYHHDADALSVRILDSHEAATYDRHSDGGALAAEHLVALASRNERLEEDVIEVRGRAVEPDER